MSIGLALLFVMVIIRTAPESAVGRTLHRWLVAMPAARLSAMNRRQLVFALLLVLAIVVGGELLAAMGPLDAGLVLLWDVSAYADALVGVAMVASVARLRPLVALVRRRITRPRARRLRRSAITRRGANDDDRPAVALAA